MKSTVKGNKASWQKQHKTPNNHQIFTDFCTRKKKEEKQQRLRFKLPGKSGS